MVFPECLTGLARIGAKNHRGNQAFFSVFVVDFTSLDSRVPPPPAGVRSDQSSPQMGDWPSPGVGAFVVPRATSLTQIDSLPLAVAAWHETPAGFFILFDGISDVEES